MSGVRFESCARAAAVRAGGRLRATGCEFDGCGVEVEGAEVDARHNYWGARDGPRVETRATTGGRRGGGGASVTLGSARAAARWAPFSQNAFHTAVATAWAHWPAEGEEAFRNAVVGFVLDGGANATLEYTVVPDAGCPLSTGRRPVPYAGEQVPRLARVPLGPDCAGARVRRRVTATVGGGGATVTLDVRTNSTPGVRRAALALALPTLPAPLALAEPAEGVSLERVTYEMRGGASAPGCADRVAASLAAAAQPADSRFVSIEAREVRFPWFSLCEQACQHSRAYAQDGDDLYLRAAVAPPAVRSALLVALRRTLDRAAASAGCASGAALWATPELIAEAHLVARGPAEVRVCARVHAHTGRVKDDTRSAGASEPQDERLDAALAAAQLVAVAAGSGAAVRAALALAAAAAAVAAGAACAVAARVASRRGPAAPPSLTKTEAGGASVVVGVPAQAAVKPTEKASAASAAAVPPPPPPPVPAALSVAELPGAAPASWNLTLGLPPLPPPRPGRASPPTLPHSDGCGPATAGARMAYVRNRKKDYLTV